MQKTAFLANRIREVFLNGTWIANTNYKATLETTDWGIAVQKQDAGNSIAALTFHVNYYLAGLLKVFRGGKLEISDALSFDMPPISGQADWATLVAALLDNAEAFAQTIESMEDAALDLPFVDARYGSILRNIEGVIEHSYYHLGQIVLLKKIHQIS
jgi:hypothetical protein